MAWVLFAAVNWGWHFSTLYDQALENQRCTTSSTPPSCGAALLFWWPVVGADPSPWRLPHPVRLLYLFLAMPQNSFLGVALMSAPTVLYPHYLTNVRDWGPTPLEDQQLGGVIMWVVGDLAFLAGDGLVVVLWMRHEDRRTARLDRGWPRNGRRARNLGRGAAEPTDRSARVTPGGNRSRASAATAANSSVR